MDFAHQGWIVLAIMPIFALGDIDTPAFQALASRQVDPARQGQLQGVLTSAVSLASIIGPLLFSTFYFVVQKEDCPPGNQRGGPWSNSCGRRIP
jgi:MFS transporter, DHA1 family, tetracycline resistance protein